MSVKQEWTQLAARLRAAGNTWVEIAQQLRNHAQREDGHEMAPLTALRLAHGWTQDEAARAWTERWPDAPKTFKEFSNWETGRHTPRLDALDKLAQLYSCDLADLLADRPGYRDRDSMASEERSVGMPGEQRDHPDRTGSTEARARRGSQTNTAPSAPANDAVGSHGMLSTTWSDPDEVDVDRRSFMAGAVLATLRLPASIRTLLESDRGPVSPEDVAFITAYLENFRQQDAAVGGDAVLGLAMAVHERVTVWLAAGPPTEIRRTLQAVRADLGAQVAWLAFDAGRSRMAQLYIHDAIVDARLLDLPSAEVRAMSCLCLLLNRAGRPGEALQCAEAAQRIAEPWATPRLRSLLHLRCAASHAELGDSVPFVRELRSAEQQLDHADRDDDPAWTRFVGQQELAGVAGHAYQLLGQPDRAASTLRGIIQDPDSAHHRNVVFYTVQLAHAVAQQGDASQAATIGLEVLPAVNTLRSGRTRRELRGLRVTLDAHRRTSPQAADFADAYDCA